jgi:glucokinase
VTLAPATAPESDVLNQLRASFGHVSAERVLSGPGLVNLHQALLAIAGVPPISYTPAQIADPLICERDPYCREAVEMFCAILGTVAGNLALTIGALGGIYIAGGIVPKLGNRFAQSQFRQRFEEKGRLQPYLARIPTFVIAHPFPAFVGLSKMLRD